MSEPPIFLVGVPRSGTTLLASILSAHSRLAAGPETAYFASLAAAGEPLPKPGDWPGSLVAFAESATLEGESLLERFGVDGERLQGLLAGVQPSPVGALEALGQLTAERAGKQRWVEKSPVHLLYAEEIRRWFPLAHLVRIVRDPRDVARSLTRVPWGPEDLAGGLLYWRRFHERSRRFFESDPLSYTVRFEELVTDPWPVVRRLCSFLGEQPEEQMVADSRSTAELVREGESWKSNAGAAIDRSRIERWREWPEDDLRVADAILGDCLRELDYPLAGETPGSDWIWLHPRHEDAAGNAELRRDLAEGHRLWPVRESEAAARGLLIGEPDLDDWLGRGSWERLRAAVSIVWRVLGLRLRGRKVAWYRRQKSERRGGLASRFLSGALRPLTTIGARGA